MSSSPDPIHQWHRQAQAELLAGRLREAHQLCLSILQAQPNHADALFICGVIAASNGRLAKAVDIIERAVALAPSRADYLAELGKILVQLRKPGAALVAARAGLALSPEDPLTLNTLGVTFSHAEEHHQAVSCFRGALTGLEHRPAGSADAQWLAQLWFNLGASCKFTGDFDGSEQAYEQAIALQPGLFKAHSALSQLRRQTPEHNHLQRLEALVADSLPATDRLHLGHAIAREREDLGDYTAALQALQWAKDGQRLESGYQFEQDQALFAAVTGLFDADFFQRVGAGCTSMEPIFIVGMPRTGTTLVERILSAHPGVFAAGELQAFPVGVKRLGHTPGAEVLASEVLEQAVALDFKQLGEHYLRDTRPRTGHTQHFIDKLPINFFYLGLIRAALPRAKLICLRRDPMDTCLSNYRQLFATGFQHYHYTYDLEDCGRYYLAFDRLMQHWQQVLPDGVYEIQYEELVQAPETQARALLAHCGLEWDPRCLDFHRQDTAVSTASAVQVRQGIYTSSVGRWQHYASALGPLQEILQSRALSP
jgi:tetratricopeptide (TPR) repeat protein